MRFGANYIPSKRWLHFWLDFDETHVREDLQALKDMGFDHVRAHLIWPYFQVNATSMSSYCLKNLEKFGKICSDIGIDFVLSLFTGWMSGFFFFPSWMNAHAEFLMFSGAAEREAERFYVKEIAKVVADCPAFLGFDLGNELSCVTGMDKKADINICTQWQNEMLELCEQLAPGKLHNNGVDHQPWFLDTAFTKEALANTGAVTAIHCWTEFTGAAKRKGLLGTDSLHIAEYFSELAKAYSKDINRKVWIQEFGCSGEWLRDNGDSIEEFTTKTLDVIGSLSDMWGFTWWCSHDVNASLSQYLPLEYDLGLLDTNNNIKPAGAIVSKWINDYKKSPIAVPKRKTAMVFYPEKQAESEWYNPARYMELIEKGERPAIILPDDAKDPEWCKKRGIETIIY